MTSFSLWREGGRECNCQTFETGRISCYIKIEHTFPNVHSSTIYDFTMPHYPPNQHDVSAQSLATCQVLATQEQFSVLPDVTNFVLRCYPCLTVEKGCIAFQSNSLSNHKPPTRLFCSYFYSRFLPHTSYNSTRCAIHSTRERFCFHYGQNRKLHALPPPSTM